MNLMSNINPQMLLQQMLRQDPRAEQAMGMLRGKNEAQLRAMAENMAKERGTTVEEVARGLGLRLPK